MSPSTRRRSAAGTMVRTRWPCAASSLATVPARQSRTSASSAAAEPRWATPSKPIPLPEPARRQALAGELDAALEQPPPDAAALRAGIDRERPQGRHRPARMDPGDADDPVVLLGHDAAQRIELEEVADVAAAVGGRGDRRDEAVRERGAVESDEGDVAPRLDVARLRRTPHQPPHYRASRRPLPGRGSAGPK